MTMRTLGALVISLSALICAEYSTTRSEIARQRAHSLRIDPASTIPLDSQRNAIAGKILAAWNDAAVHDFDKQWFIDVAQAYNLHELSGALLDRIDVVLPGFRTEAGLESTYTYYGCLWYIGGPVERATIIPNKAGLSETALMLRALLLFRLDGKAIADARIKLMLDTTTDPLITAVIKAFQAELDKVAVTYASLRHDAKRHK